MKASKISLTKTNVELPTESNYEIGSTKINTFQYATAAQNSTMTKINSSENGEKTKSIMML